jgi:hypothetical protein
MAEPMGSINTPAPRGAQHITESYAPFSDAVAPVSTTGEEKRQTYLEALRSERRGYEAAGRLDRVAGVDAEIKRVKAQSGAEFATPAPANPGEPISIRVRT